MSVKPRAYEAEILVNEKVGGYYRLVFQDDGTLSRVLPGQFVNLRVADGWEPLLRRPYSVARLLPGRRGPRVEILYAALKRGSRLLSRRAPGERLGVLGPLGRPFPLLDSGRLAYIVSGGIGVAPLIFLSEYLKRRGTPQRVFLGARTKADLLELSVFRSLRVPLRLATDDGTAGRRGFVTDALEEDLVRTPPPKGALVYACGPRPMFRALHRIAEKYGLSAHLAWEEHMACGLGICLTCVCPLKGEGGPLMVRSCLEGPVFESTRIDWAAVERGGGLATGEPA